MKEFDLESRLDLKWIYKTDNLKKFKNQAEKIKKKLAKKIKVDNDVIEKNIEKGEFDAINNLGKRFDKFEERSKLIKLHFKAF